MSVSLPNIQGSIRQRLLIMLLVSAACIAILLFVVVQSVAEQIAQESQDNILAASAISILDSARVVEGEISIDLPYSSLSMLDSVTDERAFYAIRLNDEFLSGYSDLPRITPPSDVTAFQSTTYLDEDIRIASTWRNFSALDGQAYLEISVAQTLTGLNQSIARISRISLAVGFGFFLLSMVIAMVIAQTTIRPLHRLTGSVSRRGPSDLRPLAAPVPTEMAPLVSSLNSLMTRLQKSLSRSEDFIAEAAHRVRTPMAIVRTQAEVTLRRVEKEENRQAVREMIRAVDESSRTAGQLLDHAMVSVRTDNLARQSIQLDELIVDVANRLHPISELRDLEIVAKKWSAPRFKAIQFWFKTPSKMSWITLSNTPMRTQRSLCNWIILRVLHISMCATKGADLTQPKLIDCSKDLNAAEMPIGLSDQALD